MATARDLVEQCLRLIHVVDPDEAPTNAEATDALSSINDMIDEMSMARQFIFTTRGDDVTWTGGQASQTIGSGGDFNITRPIKLTQGCYIVDDNSNHDPLQILDNKEAYNAIVDKTTTSDIPLWIHYEASYPLGTLYIWPVPSSNLTVHLESWQQLTQLTSLSTTLALAPGYKNLFKYNACRALAAEFGVALPPEVAALARAVNRSHVTNNLDTAYMQTEIAGYDSQPRYNIYTD